MSENNAKSELLVEGPIFDTYILYQFLKKLTTPFVETEAYKLGIIDDQGNVLKKRRTLKTEKEKAAFTVFDLVVNNLKKIISKVPGGKSLIASSVAALFLIREEKNAEDFEDEDVTYEAFLDFFENMIAQNKTLKQFLKEQKRTYSKSEAKRIGSMMDIDWDKVDLEQFRKGLGVESEHDDGTELDVVGSEKDLAKIVLAHLKELPNYYDKLEKVEEDAPANSVGGGGVSGLSLATGGPIIHKKRKKLKDFVN